MAGKSYWISFFSTHIHNRIHDIERDHADDVTAIKENAVQKYLAANPDLAALYNEDANLIARIDELDKEMDALKAQRDTVRRAFNSRFGDTGYYNRDRATRSRIESEVDKETKDAIAATEWMVEIENLKGMMKKIDVKISLASTDKVLRETVERIAALLGIGLEL